MDDIDTSLPNWEIVSVEILASQTERLVFLCFFIANLLLYIVWYEDLIAGSTPPLPHPPRENRVSTLSMLRGKGITDHLIPGQGQCGGKNPKEEMICLK